MSDFLRLAFDEEGRDVFANVLSYEGDWPPPEYIETGGIKWRRVSASRLPAGMDRVARGALYVFDATPSDDADEVLR